MHLQNIIRNMISIASLVAVICILYYTDKQNLGVFLVCQLWLTTIYFIFVVLMVFFNYGFFFSESFLL